MNQLEHIGFDDWFHRHGDADRIAAHDVARVVTVHKDSYVITRGDGDVFAECSGNLLYTSDSALELPTTGDWVYADFYDDDTHAIIHGVLPRKTLLKRKTAGKQVDFQLIAANIDTAFIMQSADYNFNPRRLERYLVMVREHDITPVILLSKCDLISPGEAGLLKEQIGAIAPHIAVVTFSNLTGEHLESVKGLLESGRTYCLLGSSGVGKTTLLNRITGNELFETRSVSRKENKGRHTTTNRELVILDNGALLIDTPGMRELGNMAIDTGIDETFAEILDLAEHCQFRDCSHSLEKGCAVQAALKSGELDEQRYANYVKLKNESAFHDMSYVEKRRKDKDFGKMIKSVLKNKNKRQQ